MPSRVVVYAIKDHHRSGIVTKAMLTGIRSVEGADVELLDEARYIGPRHQVAVFYGLAGKCDRILRDYREAGLKAIYIDLGYWGRREGGRWTGFHKISVNDRHPTAYFQSVAHKPDRFVHFGLPIERFRPGTHIVLAGMGDKGAEAEGYAPEQWERQAIAQIQAHSKRAIIYRPKPSWKGAKRIPGMLFSPPTVDIATALRHAHALVTHHSNAAVDALLAGVPTFAWKGVAAPMSLQDFQRIDLPWQADGRDQWAADIAYTQWSVAEMAKGLPWLHLRDEGII